MPYASNAGTRIYFEVAGSGPPLVLQHGTMGSGANWRIFGWTDALKDLRQLILIDARGHGRSDKPHDPAAYPLSARVGDVTAVLDALGHPTADYMGYSMGGWIGFGLAHHAPNRVRSLLLGGAHPFAENMQAMRDQQVSDPALLRASSQKQYGTYFKEELVQNQIANDFVAVRALTTDRASFADVLPKMTMPCFLYCGAADPRLERMRECAETMPDARLHVLPGCDHTLVMARGDLVLPAMRAFLSGQG